MQKKMIALAIASLASGAAFAQTSVTIYGVADVGQAWVKSSGTKGAGTDQKTVGRLDSNDSHLGFKGSEDLGNGLKAVFQFESGIAVDTGGFAGGRDSYLGLSGNFGTIVGGRLTHPLRDMGARVDILPDGVGIGTVNSITGAINGFKTGADDRASNAVAYVTPTFGGGFSATLAYINGENRNGNGDDNYNARAWQAAGQYENGPLFVGIGYHQTRDNVTNDAIAFVRENTDARVWRVAGVYAAPFGTRFSALYDNTRIENDLPYDPATKKGSACKRSAWSLGALHPFGAHALGLQYGRSGETRCAGEGNDLNDRANIWTAAYQYAFSKRTMAHARYSRLKNDKGGDFNFYNNPVGNGNIAGTDST
jgi:predicted porin